MRKLQILIAIMSVLIISVIVILSAKYHRKSEDIVTTTEIITTKTTTEENTTEATTIETTTEESTTVEVVKKTTVVEIENMTSDDGYVSPEFFRERGRIYGNGYWFTWYSERVLPGKGLDIPDRHSDGYYVRDEDEYIVLASPDLQSIPKGTVIETPFGMGKVYDHNPSSDAIDVYVSW